MIKKIILILLIFGKLLLADYKIEMSVDRDQLAVNEIVRLSVSVIAEKVDLNKVPDPQINGLDNFRILNQSQSTNISIINGDYQSTKKITYGIMAMKAGKYDIGPAWVEIGGKRYESEKLAVNVAKGGKKNQGSSNQSQISSSAKKEIKKDKQLFLTAEPAKKSCYIYEPVNIVYKLYTRVAVENFGVESLPKASNFWLEEDQSRDEIKQYHKNINGHRYLVAELKEVVVFPTETGKLEITPLVINCQVRSRSRDPFDDFFSSSFFARTEKVQLSSSSITLNVLNLPKKGKPPVFFDSNVGVYQIHTEVNEKQVEANQGITYKVVISGEGNVKMIKEPVIEFPKNFTSYLSNTNDKMVVKNGKVFGEKSIEYALIPLLKGNYDIPKVEFKYFNHINKAYEVASSDPIGVEVSPGAKGERRYSGFTQSEINILNEDINFIKPVPTSDLSGSYGFPGWLWVVYLALLLLIPVAYFHSSHLDKMHSDIYYARSHSAGKESKSRLKTAKGLLKGDDSIAYYEELYRAIVKFITDKKGLENQDLDLWEVERVIRENGMETEKAKGIREFLDKCQMIRFSPTKVDLSTKNKDFENAKEILDKLNRILK